MKFREATVEDIEGIEKLLYQVHKVHSDIRPDLFLSGKKKFSSEELKNIISDNSWCVIICEQENRIIAHMFSKIIDYSSDKSHKNIKTFFIEDFCVDESERKLGIGKKLYEYSKEHAKKLGCYNIALNVWEGNTEAIKFYNSLNMKVQKTTMEEII